MTTHTLRASHGEAPAQPDQPIACSYGDNGYACCEGGPCQADVHNDKLAEQPAPSGATVDEGFLRSVVMLCNNRGASPVSIENFDNGDKWIADLWRQAERLLSTTQQPAPATQQAGERVYAFRRKGLEDFCTCDEARYEELSNKPHLFETRVFYTAPQPSPAAQGDAIEHELAMLIRRIVSSARRNCQDESNVLKLANEAWAYLVRKGLGGSPLRDAGIESDVAPQAADSVQEDAALVCDYCGALTPDPWHSSGMLHGKMSKHIHSCDACAARGAAEAQAAKQQEQLI